MVFHLSNSLILVALSVLLVTKLSTADPDIPVDYSDPNFKSENFVYRNLSSLGKATFVNVGGSQHAAHVTQFPALQGLGTSLTLLRFQPCGMNTPHVHPRATEFQYIFQGTLIIVFVDTNNTVKLNKVSAGDVFVFPRGLLHYEQNIGRTEVISTAFFDSQLAGTIGINSGLRALPLRAQAATFDQYNATKLNKLFNEVKTGNFVPDPECLKYFAETTNQYYDYSNGPLA
jgi:quercetin dioxygenase-like cupin family protein